MVAPRVLYPRGALRRGIQGYVIVGYTITESGSINDQHIIESKCSSYGWSYSDCDEFDSIALRTIKRWEYKPIVLDGKTVAVEGMEQKFTFELN